MARSMKVALLATSTLLTILQVRRSLHSISRSYPDRASSSFYHYSKWTKTTYPSTIVAFQLPNQRPIYKHDIDKSATSRRPQLPILDILSIGSNQRPEYLKAQRETLGRHRAVRYFVAATENEDSTEPDCSKNLTRKDAQSIAQFCRLPDNETIVEGTPRSVLRFLRQQYFDWDLNLAHRDNPEGWICAQRRPIDALNRLAKRYKKQDISLPDYLLIADDDTFLNLPEVLRTLRTLYDSNTPVVILGCLIQMKIPGFFTNPYGGWGTLLSRSSLERLLRPIHCTGAAATSSFEKNACSKLDNDLFDEQQHWKDGMTVVDLMHQFSAANKFLDYKSWDDEKSASFCVHSDWIWGYFFNYYSIGSHTGDPYHTDIPHDRMTSYKRSEDRTSKAEDVRRKLAMKGQCFYSRKCCDESAEICHYVKPRQMYALGASQQLSYPNQFAQNNMTRAGDDWKALWLQNEHMNDTAGTPPEPIVGNFDHKIKIFVYPPKSEAQQDWWKHSIIDGIQRSSRLDFSSIAQDAKVWFVNVHEAKLDKFRYCNRFVSLIESYNASHHQHFRKPCVIFLYWDEIALNDFSVCYRATRRLDSTNVFRYKRSMVAGRHWNKTRSFVEPGKNVNFGNWRVHSGASVKKLSCGVKTDIVEAIQKSEDRAFHITSSTTFPQKGERPAIQSTKAVSHARTSDVATFLPKTCQDRLCDAVKDTLLTISTEYANEFKTYIHHVNETRSDEVELSYITRLLDTKIVVVSQPDRMEDDSKLMDALAAGALVFTDPMLTLPAGLRNGESLVVYFSLEDLVSKLKYYLMADQERTRIASKGHEVAMTLHRSWQKVEHIVFNDVLLRQE